MPEEKILAVIVTFNPGSYLKVHVDALRAQVKDVLIIDNSSDNVDFLQEIINDIDQDVRAIFNRKNVGIATALNQAARIAKEEGFKWLWTFDQDSLLPLNARNYILRLYDRHPLQASIGLLSIQHKDRFTGKEYHHRLDIIEDHAEWRSLRSTITAGSLIKVNLLIQAGGFDDSLFIDSVDHDFCLKIRRQAWKIIELKGVFLEHSIGSATEHNLLGRKLVCTHHSPSRRYYMTRNQLEVCRRNFFHDPIWSIKGFAQIGVGSIATLIYESERWLKFQSILLGLIHFAMRKFGQKP